MKVFLALAADELANNIVLLLQGRLLADDVIAEAGLFAQTEGGT